MFGKLRVAKVIAFGKWPFAIDRDDKHVNDTKVCFF